MTNPVVVAYARTPFTRSLVGGLANVSEFDLASTVIREVINRSGVDPELIDNIVLGEVLQGGGCIARYSALDMGLPLDTPAVAVGGWCASGMMAMHQAVATIKAGMGKCVIAGGLNTPSASPLAGPKNLVPATLGQFVVRTSMGAVVAAALLAPLVLDRPGTPHRILGNPVMVTA